MHTRGGQAERGAGARAARAPPAGGALVRTAGPMASRVRAGATAPHCLHARRAPASPGWQALVGVSHPLTACPGPSSSASLRPPVPPPAGPMCEVSHPVRPTAPGMCSGARPELSQGLWEGCRSPGHTRDEGKGSRWFGLRPAQRSMARVGGDCGQPRALI